MSYKDKSLSDYPVPDSTMIERQLLSDLVGNPDVVGEVDAVISPEMFTSDDRRAIYDAVVAMFYSEKRIDYSTVFGRVGNKFTQEVINPNVETGTTPTDTMNHAEALRVVDVRRKAYKAAVDLLNVSVMPGVSEEVIFAEVDSIGACLKDAKQQKEESTMLEVVNEIAEEIQTREVLAKEGRTTRVPSGFPSLDSLTYNGFGPGQLIILAARPSVGKTAVMLQMAKSAAERGFPATIFSLEMTKSELGQRMLFSTGLVDPMQVATGCVNWERFEAASANVSRYPITINDSARQLRKIASKIQIFARRGQCKIAFIDYLGLVKDVESAKLPLYQQIAKITGDLKAVAKDAKIPIVLLCQLNRASASEERAPQLYDLRDSGSIEQDADIVLMLEATKDKTLNMWVRKNRQYRKEVCINLQPNETYSEFTEINAQEPF